MGRICGSQMRSLDASSEWCGINTYNQIISLAQRITLAWNWARQECNIPISGILQIILQIMYRQNAQERLFCTGCSCYSLFFCQYFPYKLLLFIGLAVGHKILLLAGTWQTASQVRKMILNKFLKYMICIGALLKLEVKSFFSEKKTLVSVFFSLKIL